LQRFFWFFRGFLGEPSFPGWMTGWPRWLYEQGRSILSIFPVPFGSSGKPSQTKLIKGRLRAGSRDSIRFVLLSRQGFRASRKGCGQVNRRGPAVLRGGKRMAGLIRQLLSGAKDYS
jgi:hypothetical protein